MTPPLPILAILSRIGITNAHFPYICGDYKRLHLHKSVEANNTLFNTMSGDIWVGEDSFFGHNCMVITGRHNRTEDMRKSVPLTGYDIKIESRCWIASGAIVLGGVTIGSDSTIAAGSIITKNVIPNSVIKGVH
jgi:acetyltransferase-like isoleucine patch superfamily enzyme